MERKYNVIIGLLAVLAIASLAGFLKTYLVYFPRFEGVSGATHFHFSMFLLWILIVLYQPYLMKTKQLSRHKSVGKLTYLLAPVLIVTVWFMIFQVVQKNIVKAEPKALISATGAILDSVTFSICYLISMWNTQRMRIHTAFLIGACLVIFNSGIGRLIALISNDLAILVMVLLPIIIPGAIMVYEKAKLRRAMLKSPYLLFMLIWILEVIVFITLPQQEFWKGFIRGLL